MMIEPSQSSPSQLQKMNDPKRNCCQKLFLQRLLLPECEGKFRTVAKWHRNQITKAMMIDPKQSKPTC